MPESFVCVCVCGMEGGVERSLFVFCVCLLPYFLEEQPAHGFQWHSRDIPPQIEMLLRKEKKRLKANTSKGPSSQEKLKIRVGSN